MTSRRQFVIGSGLVLAAGAVPSRVLARWAAGKTFFTWKDMGGGVHASHDQSSGGNVMVVVAEGSSLLVDTKFGPLSPVLQREAESFGAPVRHVLNTHHHGDHTGGNIAFSHQQIWAHENARQRIFDQAGRYLRELSGGAGAFRAFENEPEDWMLEEADKLARRRQTFEPEDWEPGRLISEPESEIAFGERTVHVHHVGPGHTDNDVFAHARDANVLHAGDLLFHEMHPYFDPNGGGSSTGWIEALEAIIKVCDAETKVVPGHGELTDVEGVKKAKAYQEQLRESVAQTIADGATREEAVEMRWDFMEGLGRERLRPRAIGFVYDELSAEG